MGCTHPFIEAVHDDKGKIVGGRCPSCRSVAYVGESFWTVWKRNVLRRPRWGALRAWVEDAGPPAALIAAAVCGLLGWEAEQLLILGLAAGWIGQTFLRRRSRRK